MQQRFCGHCGTEVTGAFCTTCGAAVATASPGPADASPPPAAHRGEGASPRSGLQPAHEPPAQPAYSTGPSAPASQPAYSPAPQRTGPYAQPGGGSSPETASPTFLASLSASDLLRDLGALFFLFASLAMPWDILNNGSDHWWVVLTTILAALAIPLPYLGKYGLVPGAGPQHVRLAKIALVAPFVAAVLAAVISELIHVTDDFEGGIGTGVAMGLAGAALAVQPRKPEDVPGYRDLTWWMIVVVLGMVGLAALILSWVVWLLRDVLGDQLFTSDALFLVALVLIAVAQLGIALGLPMIGSLRRSAPWIRVLQVVVFSILVLNLFALGNDGAGAFASTGPEKLSTEFGLFLVVGAVAMSVARPVTRVLRPADDVSSWVQTAVYGVVISALGLSVLAIRDLLDMISAEDYAATRIVAIVVSVVAVVAALAALAMLEGSVDKARIVILIILGGIVVAGIVGLAVAHSEVTTTRLNGYVAAFWFALPVLSACSLSAPKPVRNTFTPLSTPVPQTQGQTWG